MSDDSLWTAWCRQQPQPYWWGYHWQQWKRGAATTRTLTAPPWQFQLDTAAREDAAIDVTARITHLETQQGFERVTVVAPPNDLDDVMECPQWHRIAPPPVLSVDPQTFALRSTLDIAPNVFAVLRVLRCVVAEAHWIRWLRHDTHPQDHNCQLLLDAVRASRSSAAQHLATEWLLRSEPRWFATADCALARSLYLLYLVHVRHYQFPSDPRIALPGDRWRRDLRDRIDQHWRTLRCTIHEHLPLAAVMDVLPTPSVSWSTGEDADDADDSELTENERDWLARMGMLDPRNDAWTVFTRITHGVTDEEHAIVRAWLDDHHIHWLHALSVQWPDSPGYAVLWNGVLVGWLDVAVSAFECAPKQTVRELGVVLTSLALYVRTDAGRPQRMILGRGAEADAAWRVWWMDAWELDVHVCFRAATRWREPHPYSLCSWRTIQTPALGHANAAFARIASWASCRAGDCTAIAMPRGLEYTTEAGRMVHIRRHAEVMPGECWVSRLLVDLGGLVCCERVDVQLPCAPSAPADITAYPYLDPRTGVPRIGTRLQRDMVLVLNCGCATISVAHEWIGWRVSAVEDAVIVLERARAVTHGDRLRTRHGVYGWTVTNVVDADDADVWISALDQAPPWSAVMEHLASSDVWRRSLPFRNARPLSPHVDLREMRLWVRWEPNERTICIAAEPERVALTLPMTECIGDVARASTVNVCMRPDQWAAWQQARAWGYEVRPVVVSKGLHSADDPWMFPKIPGRVRLWLAGLDDPGPYWKRDGAVDADEAGDAGDRSSQPRDAADACGTSATEKAVGDVYPPRNWHWTTLYAPGHLAEERRMEATRDAVRSLAKVWQIRPEGFWNVNTQEVVPWLDEEVLVALASEQETRVEEETPWLLVPTERGADVVERTSDMPLVKRARIEAMPTAAIAPTAPTASPFPQWAPLPSPPPPQPPMLMINTGKVVVGGPQQPTMAAAAQSQSHDKKNGGVADLQIVRQ